jgi:2-polyprenyl-3-methyl-5-hydroxy-6-metoxy-1,4-benzoquinol methylase
VLDIGAWDGWFSFEAERHGAAVTAIDCVEVPNFLEIQKKLGSRVSYRILDFYELPEAGFGGVRLRLLPRDPIPPQASPAGT